MVRIFYPSTIFIYFTTEKRWEQTLNEASGKQKGGKFAIAGRRGPDCSPRRTRRNTKLRKAGAGRLGGEEAGKLIADREDQG